MKTLAKENLYIYPDECTKCYFTPFIKNFYLKRIQMVTSLIMGGDILLDIGFGSGILFYEIKDRFSELYGIDLHGSDITKKILDENGIKANLTDGDVCNLPYKDNFFDCITAVSILEHVPMQRLEKAIKEMKRVLKPDGKLICGFPVKNFYMQWGFRMLGFQDENYSLSHSDIYRTLEKHFISDKVLKFPSFLKMDWCLYMVCRLSNKTNG